MAKLGATERNTLSFFVCFFFLLDWLSVIDFSVFSYLLVHRYNAAAADTKRKANAKAAAAEKYATLSSGRAKTLFEFNSVSISYFS